MRQLQNLFSTLLRTATFLLMVFTFSCKSKTDNKIIRTTIFFNYEQIQGCESKISPCDTELVLRNSQNDDIKIAFPYGGRQVTLKLFDKNSFTKLSLSKNISIKPIQIDTTNNSNLRKLPTIKLINLDDGLYCIQMLADAYGGFKWVKIETK